MALFGLFSFSREQIDQNLFEGENNERIAKRQSELELVEKELNETKQHILDEIENGGREKEKCGGKAKGRGGGEDKEKTDRSLVERI